MSFTRKRVPDNNAFNDLRQLITFIFIGVSLGSIVTGAASHIIEDSDMTIKRLEQIRIHALTWNVGSTDPEEDFREALGLTGNNVNVTALPDVYVFGWQEVKVRLSYIVLEDEWIEFMKNLLKDFNYVKMKSTKLQGIMIVVFVKRDLLTRIREVETAFVRTGFNGLWGNKGAVAVRLTIAGCNVCFVTAHLAAHDHMNDRRIQDYSGIRDGIEFKNVKAPKILDHDQVILMGDLNFRINDLTAQEIYDRITEGSDKSRQELLQKDQLNLVRSQKEAFAELLESSLSFWPTYKFKVGSSVYDLKKRKPAFTDRILWKDPGPGRIEQHTYRSHPHFQNSDHKPVSATFTMKLFRSSLIRRTRDATDYLWANQQAEPPADQDPDDVVVDFRPIRRWVNDQENEIHFAFRDRKGNSSNSQVAERLPNRAWDWIAVVAHDFDSLDQWISYGWVNESALTDGDLVPEADASPPTAGEEMLARAASGTHFTLRFDPILNPGSRYRFIYFHGENSTSVMGISEPFLVLPADQQPATPHFD